MNERPPGLRLRCDCDDGCGWYEYGVERSVGRLGSSTF
jgi:hypothetical protein